MPLKLLLIAVLTVASGFATNSFAQSASDGCRASLDITAKNVLRDFEAEIDAYIDSGYISEKTIEESRLLTAKSSNEIFKQIYVLRPKDDKGDFFFFMKIQRPNITRFERKGFFSFQKVNVTPPLENYVEKFSTRGQEIPKKIVNMMQGRLVLSDGERLDLVYARGWLWMRILPRSEIKNQLLKKFEQLDQNTTEPSATVD